MVGKRADIVTGLVTRRPTNAILGAHARCVGAPLCSKVIVDAKGQIINKNAKCIPDLPAKAQIFWGKPGSGHTISAHGQVTYFSERPNLAFDLFARLCHDVPCVCM